VTATDPTDSDGERICCAPMVERGDGVDLGELMPPGVEGVGVGGVATAAGAEA